MFISLPGILSFTYNLRLPPFLILFETFCTFCEKLGDKSPILVYDNKQISVSLRTISLKLQHLFVIELILRCFIITFLG